MLVSDKNKTKTLIDTLSLWLKGSVRIWFNKRGLLLFIIHFIIPRRQSGEPEVAAMPIVYCVLAARRISESEQEYGWNQVSVGARALVVVWGSESEVSWILFQIILSVEAVRYGLSVDFKVFLNLNSLESILPTKEERCFPASSGHRMCEWEYDTKDCSTPNLAPCVFCFVLIQSVTAGGKNNKSVTCDKIVEKMLSCALSK